MDPLRHHTTTAATMVHSIKILVILDQKMMVLRKYYSGQTGPLYNPEPPARWYHPLFIAYSHLS